MTDIDDLPIIFVDLLEVGSEFRLSILDRVVYMRTMQICPE